MALVVEDGTGLATANAYATAAEGDTYFTDFGTDTKRTSWTGATTADKEQALILAGQALDSRYRGRWVGSRAEDLQAMAWPRTGAEDEDMIAVDDASVPVAVKRASFELAVAQIAGDDLFPDQAAGGDVLEESVKVGSIAVSEKFAGVKDPGKKFRLADALLAGLVWPAGRVIRA